MRIAFILRSEFGLLGTNASYMLPSRVARKHDVLVLTSPTGRAERDLKVYSDPDLTITPLQGANLSERLDQAVYLLECFRPDVVHLFYFRNCLQFARAARRRLEHPGKWLLDVRTPLLEEKRLRRLAIQAQNVVQQGCIDWVSSPSIGSIRSHFPYISRPVSLTSLGVAFDRFVVDETRLRKGTSRFVYVGSVARRRRIDLLIRWFAAFAERADGMVSLDVFGGGNTLEGIKDLVSRENLSGTVRLHGAINQESLFRELPRFDAGIGYVPNGHHEDAPALKILEYAAAGLPIVASNLRGIRRMTEGGIRMSLFANEQEDFVARMMDLHLRDVNPDEIRNNRAVVAQWDWDRIAERDLLPIYKRLATVAA